MYDITVTCQLARTPTKVQHFSRPRARARGVAKRESRFGMGAREQTKERSWFALDEEVVAWRCERLEEVGYELHAAIELAEAPHVDLHVAVELVKLGCPAETAARILL